MPKRFVGIMLALSAFAAQASADITADFDCNGKLDTAVSSTSGDDLLWTVFLDSGQVIEGVPLGQTGNQVFAHDLDGDACVELHAVTAKGLSTITLAARTKPRLVGGLRCDREIDTTDGSGGFVNNPNNSKGKAKLVAPGMYTNKLAAVRIAKNGKIIETVPFVKGNEWGNRQRFYSRNSPRSYGRNIVWVLDLKNGERHCALVREPWTRVD